MPTTAASANTSNGFLINAQGIHPFDLLATHGFDVVTGTPFQLVTALQLSMSVFQTGSVEGDALGTATLGFVLPAGYTISSAQGFGVPEPGASAAVLGALGVLGLARFDPRRRPFPRRSTRSGP